MEAAERVRARGHRRAHPGRGRHLEEGRHVDGRCRAFRLSGREPGAFVRGLFRRYLAIGSVVRLKAVLDQENVRLPVRTDGAGRITGGGLISRGHLYKILSNPIYVGRLSHKDHVHDGLHDPIVDRATWDRVQSLLAEHTQRRTVLRQDSDALLAGRALSE